MESWTEYKIDYSLIAPNGTLYHMDTVNNSNGFGIRSIEEAKNIEQQLMKSYKAKGYKVQSHKILSRTVTYTDWEDETLTAIFEDIVVDDSFLSDYTIEEARQLIENAVSRGFKVPKELTPEVYIKMYTARKPAVDDDYIDQICHDCAYDCMCDGIETIEDAEAYLLDIKLEGYTVPSKLTPELFLKLYKEAEEAEG